MVDRVVEGDLSEVPEIDDRLRTVLLAALKEAKQKLEAGEEVVPFTALAVKDNLFIETHPGDTAEEYYSAARHTVQHASGADAYAFCYDGYVETDEGSEDVLIAEGGIPGVDEGFALGYFYEMPEDENSLPQVNDDPIYIGPAPNFMAFTLPIKTLEEDVEEAAEGSDEMDEGDSESESAPLDR